MIYSCCDERRRNDVKSHPTLNGIDFLEVHDNPADPDEERQRTLFVHFVKDLTPGALNRENVRINGGERIHDIIVVRAGALLSSPAWSPPASPLTGTLANVLVVEVAEPGDFSAYTLRLVRDASHQDPPAGFDPVLSAVDFSFKVLCQSDFDCQRERICPPALESQPEIDYLAKDYASFRQLMLDRMATLAPHWQERNAADLGVALVELLAYVGDHLSYQQDAVATEAYLGTARRRTSVRRHARLVDYAMHDGSNARVWLHVRVAGGVEGVMLQSYRNETKDAATDGKKIFTKFLTRVEGLPKVIPLDSSAYRQALETRPQVFEPLHDLSLFAAHNEMRFYTWGARECCLPRGATQATLRGHFPNLRPGHVLILSEIRGPQTGQPGDADLAHRHAVRLTEVTLARDPLYESFAASPPDTTSPYPSSPPGFGVPVTQITWHPADALPFPLCISTRRSPDDVSVALGNIVLADHGLTTENETFAPVPAANPALTKVSGTSTNRCDEQAVTLTPPRFRPQLNRAPLTYAALYEAEKPASAAMQWESGSPLPEIWLDEEGTDEKWRPRRDLLASGPDKREFVVEVETDGAAYLRFGNDRFGSRPAANALLTATYRVGNGASGNVGADSLAHLASSDPAIVTDPSVIVSVRNPLPARGGTELESIARARADAPSAFRTRERAVTTEDYAEVAQNRCRPDVQRAAATLRWTGSWRTVFLTVDRLEGKQVDETFEKDLRRCLERYRMAGHDVEVDGACYVSLEIDMVVCVKPNYLEGDVKRALLAKLGNSRLPDGSRGLFHPDNFTFGQPVYLSRLYAAAQAVEGVDSLEITKLQRQGIRSDEAFTSGKLDLSRLEIARLDNDPNFPERGVLKLVMRGGR